MEDKQDKANEEKAVQLRQADVSGSAFSVGQQVVVFNAQEWSMVGDTPDGNRRFWQNAVIIGLRLSGEWLADVRFDSGLVSRGHFVKGIRHCR